MAIVKLVLGSVVTLICMVIAVKLLAALLLIVGLAVKLIWLALIVGLIALVCYAVYRVVWPNHTEQI
ncbi:MAG TPA: hypothetical protein VFV34_09590 [Blastocatellia bacterium]|nr:hypothetical protein [Blastocatellia bacterium]